MKTIFVSVITFLLAAAALAADTLDIYVIDTEGGKAMVLRTPAGEKMLVDAGYPCRDDRDTKRIVAVAQALGIKHFDFILATHYDSDHAGNIPRVDALIPGKVFIDHGEPIPTLSAGARRGNYEPYLKAIGDRKRISVKPGDVLPLKGLQITVLTAGARRSCSHSPAAASRTIGPRRPPHLHRQRRQRGLHRPLVRVRQVPHDRSGRSALGGGVRPDVPQNPVGTVDLFMVSHHGLRMSNAKFLVHALRPKVAIMNNGPHKGGDPETLDIVKSSPGLQDLWQLHYSPKAGSAKNAPADFIANTEDPCEGKLIKVVVQRDGTFTVTNTRNGFTKTYKP